MTPANMPVSIDIGGRELPGNLVVPALAKGVVAFAHGSGSSRHSPRNQAVAYALQQSGLATLLFDLLTEDEERLDLQTAELRFDIPLLAERLVAAVDTLVGVDAVRDLPLGLFGASTGAAAALLAAAERPDRVSAVVSRGGRPDLAGEVLGRVRAPTLLIVGGRDEQVLELNEGAAGRLRCEHRIEVVPGATHLFEEPGALDEVARLATDWLGEHFEQNAEK